MVYVGICKYFQIISVLSGSCANQSMQNRKHDRAKEKLVLFPTQELWTQVKVVGMQKRASNS